MAPLAVGWIVWRDKSKIPQDLLLESSYLRGSHTNFSLSFSHSGAPIAGQYYNFHRMGITGYREWAQTMLDRARLLSIGLHDIGYFSCLGDSHNQLSSQGANGYNTRCQESDCAEAPALPIVVFTFSDHVQRLYPKLRLPDVSDSMYDLEFSIPSKSIRVTFIPFRSNILSGYTLGGWGAHGEDIDVMRIVLRDEMTAELLGEVLTGLARVVERLIGHT